MPQNTNLNIAPYFDDFDKDKNFYKVLYRPGFPIQARELTTMQSILQNQIEAIGQHFFKEGAMVIPGQVGYDLNVQAILLQQSFLGVDVETYREQLTGRIVEGITTGVKAKILYSIPASESDRGYITLYVKYIDSGDTTSAESIKTFQDNEQLLADREITFGASLIEVGSPFAQLLPVNSSSVGSAAYIAAGVYFMRGHFVDVSDAYILLDQYGNNPSYRVGLSISESIITPEDDESLNDNAAGSSNYSAPGAHRFRISTQLVKKTLDDDSDKDFIELLRINDSKVEQFVDSTAYSELEKMIAKRTYEESGDYQVDTFRIRAREHLNDGFNDGVFERNEVSPDGNVATTEKLAIEVSPGVAYVRGYRTEFLTPQYVDVDKPRTTRKLQNQIIPFELSQSVEIYDIYGWINSTGEGVTENYQVLELYDDWTIGTTNASSGQQIGRARALQIQKDASKYRLFMFDITMFTTLYFDSSVTLREGDVLIGRSTGTRAFVVNAVNGAQDVIVEQVNGNFLPGEVIERDGRVLDTIQAYWNYEATDTRMCIGRDQGVSNVVTFGANLSLNDIQIIRGDITVDQTTNNNIKGFQSNIEADIRPGEVLLTEETDTTGATSLRVTRIDIDDPKYNSQNQSTGGTPVFDFGAQTATLDATLTKGTPDDDTYNTLRRARPLISLKQEENGELLLDMPRQAIKSIEDESFFVSRTFTGKTVTAGGVTVSLPETESFATLDDENFILIPESVGASPAYTLRSNVFLEEEVDAGNLTVTFGADRQSISISGLTDINSIKLIAAVSKNTVSRKIKTASKMQAMVVNRTREQNDVINTGLSYGYLYGTRVEDTEISFGLNDVYKVHAVYESNDTSNPKVPYITLTEQVFFHPGTIIIGQTSGARARVISFSANNLRCYNVSSNDRSFLPGEQVTGVDSNDADLVAIIDDADGSVEVGSTNITDRFELDPNQNMFMYDVSKLIRKPGFSSPKRRIMVIFDYFIHETSGDYFSNQSYSGLPYTEIPKFVGQSNQNYLTDTIDFRPGVGELASGSGTVTNPYFTNCATLDFNTRIFDTVATIFDIPKMESEIRTDYEYYLPRLDKLFLSHDGGLVVTSGVPGEERIEPDSVKMAMHLATIEYQPYVYQVPRDILILPERHRRYTMKDIGDIEKRLENVEYYTSLSLLENDALNARSFDEDGFERIKNGFLVDDFTSHNIGDIISRDYKASLDFGAGELRPSHYTTNVGLVYNMSESQNVTKHDSNIVTLPYTTRAIITQPYASRLENVNPFNVFTFIGRIDLTPSSDDWVDTVRLPESITNIEGNFETTQQELGVDENGFAPIQWNAWETTWTGTQTEDLGTVRLSHWIEGDAARSPNPNVWGGRGMRRIVERQRITTTRNQTRQGVRQRVVPRIDYESLGDTVVSTSSIPFMRSRGIEFDIFRVKPHTALYAFFDTRPVTEYCTPKIIEVIKNSAEDTETNETPFVIGEKVVGQTSGCTFLVVAPNDGYVNNPYAQVAIGGVTTLPTSYSSQTNILNHDTKALADFSNSEYFGTVQVGELLVGQTSGAIAKVRQRRLISDQTGRLTGVFTIPDPSDEANPRWATGTRMFRMTSSETNSQLAGAVDSSAQSQFEARGTIERVQENILAVRNAEIVQDTVTEDRVVVSTRVEDRQVGWYDPLAQSFIVSEDGGAFITDVDIFFGTKDTNIPVSMQIRTMENGYPSKSILPFSDVTLDPSDVEISENASLPTKFTFRAPVHLQKDIEYCFVILSDSNEYKVWISRMGDQDITGTRTISEQPYAGVLFKSQNASTWTADQYEDLKFTISRAVFDTSVQGKLVFNNATLGVGNNGVKNLRTNPITTIKPKQVLQLPASGSWNFTVGARLVQDPSGAEGTIIEYDSSTKRITISDIVGNWNAGFLTGGGEPFERIKSSQSTVTFVLATITGDGFTVGQTITGSGSTDTGIVKSYDSDTSTLIVHYIDGEFDLADTLSNSGNTQATITSKVTAGDSFTAYPESAPSYRAKDKQVIVRHPNHCMHQTTNNVEIKNVISEITPTVLTSELSDSATSINVEDASIFHTTVNNAVISNVNPGFLKIGNEIIQYSAISDNGQVITVATNGRGAADTTAAVHPSGTVVECYTLDGIPLTEINKVHTSIDNQQLDLYTLQTTSVATNGIVSGGGTATASQNIQYEVMTPTVTTVQFPSSTVTTRVNTTTGTSIGNHKLPVDQASFINTGSYVDIQLNKSNYFSSPQLIASSINEANKMTGAKSLTMQFDAKTSVDNLSPIFDLDRVSLITTSNRINDWPGGNIENAQIDDVDTTLDASTNPVGDLNNAVYVTRIARLNNIAKTLKIAYSMNKYNESRAVVYIKTFKVGSTVQPEEIKWVKVEESETSDLISNGVWRDYEFEVKNLEFDVFQVKIVMKSSNQAFVPRISDLRVTALAS